MTFLPPKLNEKLKQHAFIKFCIKTDKKNISKTQKLLQQAFGDCVLVKTQINKWHRSFKCTQKTLENNEWTDAF